MKLLPLRQNLIVLNIPISKLCSKPNCASEIDVVLYQQGLKNSLALEDRLNRKFSKIKKWYQLKFQGNVAENRDIKILRIIFKKWF